jgi:ornithine carbamoyltransferase
MKHFLSINDLSHDDALFLLAEATRLKTELRDNLLRQRETLAGKTLALVFEKPSLRTRVCDIEHPCQALADVLTLREHKGLEGRKVVYVGDGNNVCHSLMLLCTKLGVRFAAATPEHYAPDMAFVHRAREDGEVELFHDAREAAQGADAIYTDVWTSMGQEEESARRREVFPPFQINADLMREAKPDAMVLHCLPAHRGEEIDAETFEKYATPIFDQAENRLHAQKAVLVWLMGTAHDENLLGEACAASAVRAPVMGDR